MGILAISTLLAAQATVPTVYSITKAGQGTPTSTIVLYRNGDKVVQSTDHPEIAEGSPGHRAMSLLDLKTGTSYGWDPAITPLECSMGTFKGDWGDPFDMTAELLANIAKGDFKVTGSETLNGIATKVYEHSDAESKVKAWFDEKDGLVIKVMFGPPGGDMQALVDIRKLSLATPPASLFVLPAACASLHRAPTQAEQIAAETGDSADNYVNANYGPGSKNSCSVVVRVVRAGAMTPITRYQAAIDTTYEVNHPPNYVTGVGTDGMETFSGGGIHEITSQIHNGMLRIEDPPDHFLLDVNLIKAGYGSGGALIYRQCFAPTTVLLYVVKDPDKPSAGGDWLWAKAGKYAAAPGQ
jgi:hypothetical protein